MRIVVTGIGPLTATGHGASDCWNSIIKSSTNIVRERTLIENEVWEEFFVHKIQNFSINQYGLDQEILNYIHKWKGGEEVIDLYFFFAVIALAIKDSMIDIKNTDIRFGTILSHENMCFFQFVSKICNFSYDAFMQNPNLTRKEFFQEVFKNCERSGYDVQSFVSLFQITKIFNIHNFSIFTNNACASGLYSLELAAQLIRGGNLDVAVVAAVDSCDVFKYLWFKKLNIYSNTGEIRPFCKYSDGFVIGEGGAAVVLESLDNAIKRGAKIYAEYAGGGFDLEGWKITAPEIGGNSLTNTIFQALKIAGVKKNEVDLICPHGVGVKVIDYYESQSIANAFKENLSGPAITAFKPYFGHTLGGSSLLETAALLLSLYNNYIPRTLNYQESGPKIRINLVKEGIKKKVRTALKTCCAFAGYNASVIFKKYE